MVNVTKGPDSRSDIRCILTLPDLTSLLDRTAQKEI